jgi:hypothetical protein
MPKSQFCIHFQEEDYSREMDEYFEIDFEIDVYKFPEVFPSFYF